MTWWQAAILGLVQGLTEFLPVSSSGHLVLGQYVLGLDTASAEDVTFEVFTHFGTALSILTVYRRDVGALIRATVRSVLSPRDFREAYATQAPVRTAALILITLVPTGIVYILFKDALEAAFAQPRLVSGMLIVTGLLLLLTLLRKRTTGEMTPVKAFVVGIAQSVAMIPGISRSGSTICVAIYQNVRQEEAANFSFLMVLPVIIGAAILKFGDAFGPEGTTDILPVIIGTVVAYFSGIVAIKIVIAFVRKGNLSWFAYYCFVVGGLGLWLI
ncbi:MAG TPA: undecaprenyl-diphosphate phosphatase [Rhodothermales bacterium]|nr:undecaprenyl-diphosphate phosphatase [Rhodothermales bacterium]